LLDNEVLSERDTKTFYSNEAIYQHGCFVYEFLITLKTFTAKKFSFTYLYLFTKEKWNAMSCVLPTPPT